MSGLVRRVYDRSAAICAAVVASLFLGSFASATVTIPDAGVSVDAFITAAITAMGAVVAVAVGGYFAFLIVKMALRWGRQALRG